MVCQDQDIFDYSLEITPFLKNFWKSASNTKIAITTIKKIISYIMKGRMD